MALEDLLLAAFSVLLSFQNKDSEDSVQTGSDTCLALPWEMPEAETNGSWSISHPQEQAVSQQQQEALLCGPAGTFSPCPRHTLLGRQRRLASPEPFCVRHTRIQHKSRAALATWPLTLETRAGTLPGGAS